MDIDINNTWLISDTHWGHENIKGFCHRPDDFEQIIMEEWARAVGPDDTLIHLGDLSYRGNAWFQNMIAKHLTGNKYLILGNHDRKTRNFYRKCGFKILKPQEFYVVENSGYGLVTTDKPSRRSYTISLSHYPATEVLKDNEIRIHGHIHNNGYTRDAFVPFLKNHINISVEQTKYKPVHLKLLLEAVILGTYPESSADPSGEVEADALPSKKEQTYA